MVDRETRVQEFKSGLESDLSSVESEIASHKSELDRLGQERDALQQLIGEANRFLSNIRGDNGRSGTVVRVPPRAGQVTNSAPSRESTPTTNGLPKDLTRRQVVVEIIPNFHGRRFNSGDVRRRFVQDYLGGVEPPNFPQAINNLLKRMADKGEIQDLGRDESEFGAPRYYREIEDQEEALNLGP
jgi:hypothetical protein